MSRQKWICWNNGGDLVLVDVAELPKYEQKAPAVHTDIIPPTWHPSNGKYYESKSAFREVTRAHGCVEVGNDFDSHKFERRKLPPIKDALVENYQRARDG